jgi:hypothetical protein
MANIPFMLVVICVILLGAGTGPSKLGWAVIVLAVVALLFSVLR